MAVRIVSCCRRFRRPNSASVLTKNPNNSMRRRPTRPPMSEYDLAPEPKEHHAYSSNRVEEVERQKPSIKGTIAEQANRMIYEGNQHPGRLEGGKETVLRPD